jgi:hypothetical protein
MKKLILILACLSLLTTVSMGCKAEGSVDTTAVPQHPTVA